MLKSASFPAGTMTVNIAGCLLIGFGGGPRICLGKRFAKLQLMILVEELVRVGPSFQEGPWKWHIQTRFVPLRGGLPQGHHPCDLYEPPPSDRPDGQTDGRIKRLESILFLARSMSLAPLAQGKIWVPGPKGSSPVPQKVCQ